MRLRKERRLPSLPKKTERYADEMALAGRLREGEEDDERRKARIWAEEFLKAKEERVP